MILPVKTRSNRIKDSAAVPLEVRQERIVTWGTLFAFVLGAAIGELAPEPTDWVYFMAQNLGWTEQNVALSVFVWYYLSAIFYFIILGICILMYKQKIGKPIYVIWALIVMIFVSAILSFRFIIEDVHDVWTAVFVMITMILITFLGFVYMMGYDVKLKKKSKRC